MKRWVKNFLKKHGWYYFVKYSWLFHFYEKLFKPSLQLQHRREVDFYRSFLPACNLVFDIGANDGHKTLAFLEIASKVISIEPDEENARLLKTRFRNNKNVHVERLAVSDENGTATMHIHHSASAFNTLSPKWKELLERQGEERWKEEIRFTSAAKVQTRTVDSLIHQYGKPDFIKIDVEGFEPYVLRGLSTKIPCISFESLLPEYKDECLQCLDKIHQLDNHATFNIAKEERLLLQEFVSINQIKDWINWNGNANTIEVIAKMNTTQPDPTSNG